MQNNKQRTSKEPEVFNNQLTQRAIGNNSSKYLGYTCLEEGKYLLR